MYTNAVMEEKISKDLMEYTEQMNELKEDKSNSLENEF